MRSSTAFPIIVTSLMITDTLGLRDLLSFVIQPTPLMAYSQCVIFSQNTHIFLYEMANQRKQLSVVAFDLMHAKSLCDFSMNVFQ